MKVVTFDKTYWVRWVHHLPKMKFWKGKYRVITKGETICTIYDDTVLGNPKLILTGSCSCSLKDQYRKETGRILSLSRAIKDLDLADRIVFTEAYNNRKK